MLKRIIPFTHSIIKDVITSTDIAIDCTAGNGHDTLFLATLANHVYSFDIQEEAIKNTKERLNKHALNNVTLYQESHTRLLEHSIQSPKIIVYNLGYLPGGDPRITTSSTSTLSSIKQSLELLAINGLITITIYPAHEQGQEEHRTIIPFVTALDSTYFDVITYKYENKLNAPYTVFITKKRALPSNMF